MSHIEDKLARVDKFAELMKQKFIEKEPRPHWLTSGITTEKLLEWLVKEVAELVDAKTDEERWREAADVANLAMVYADVAAARTPHPELRANIPA